MRRIGRVCITLVAVLAVAVISLLPSGCASHGEHPSGTEHPSETEHPSKMEHPE